MPLYEWLELKATRGFSSNPEYYLYAIIFLSST